MMKILQIIGARPQIIKAAAISRAIRNYFSEEIEDVILHTGQHYDSNMSDVFMNELQVPKEKYNLSIGSLSHGKQTAQMIDAIEEVILKESPQVVLVYGDTNSTLAASVAAVKIHVPIVHVEAGLRSYNKSMPEEINRIMCDHSSHILFTPTKAGITNLRKEGFEIQNEICFVDKPAIYHCGDIMYDNTIFYSQIADEKIDIESEFGISSSKYILSTIHRPSNTDSEENLRRIFAELDATAQELGLQVVVPLHPRTESYLEKYSLLQDILIKDTIKIVPPASFLQMIALEKNAACVVTDSGGVQKESFFCNKPCVIVRDETEWTEIVEEGCAVLSKPNQIKEKTTQMLSKKNLLYSDIFGNGHAAEFICERILAHLG